MGELRAMIEKDLGVTLEGDYGLPCTLVGPDGTIYPPVMGRFVRDHIEANVNGETVVVNVPMMTLRLSSLARIPKADEHWEFRIAATPGSPVLTSYFLDPSGIPVGGETIGFKRFPLTKAVQS